MDQLGTAIDVFVFNPQAKQVMHWQIANGPLQIAAADVAADVMVGQYGGQLAGLRHVGGTVDTLHAQSCSRRRST